MKNTHLLLTTFAAFAAVGALALTGCSGDDTNGGTDNDSGIVNNDSGPGGDGGPGTDSGPKTPAPPTLGAQIDRFGRPAINTALNHAFDPNATTKGAAKDAYNQDQGVAGWPAAYSGQFFANLAVLDSLDTGLGAQCTVEANGCGCGNQFGFGAGGKFAYTTLAGALGDDRLYVNTAGNTCLVYLAVEGNALGTTNNDCGGRRPNDDVIATTYTAASGVTFDDGVSAPSSPATATFPYLADPH